MHMQIIAVGVSNRRDQQKVCGPFWTALMHVRAFSCYLTFNNSYHLQVRLEF